MINGTQTETVIGAGKSGKVVAFRADNGKRLWTRNVGVHKFDSGPFPLKKAVCYEPGFLGGVETPMAASGNLVYVPFVNLCFDATATGIKSAGGFNGGTGGLAALDSATGKIVWQKNLPSPAYGAATVANDVVFTATLAGKIYAFDTQTGKALSTMTGPAGINAFPAVTKNMLIIGAGASSPAIKKPQNEIVAYSLNAPAGGAKTQTAPSAGSASSATAGSSASTTGVSVQVKGGEFFFRLSTKSAAKPGKVTFVFKNIGHVQHDFRIAGKQTPLLQPGKTAKLVVTFKKKGKYTYLCTVPGHAQAGMKGVFTVR
jgi:uncharacterized cupredoxin-like copper-binding protein